MNIIKRYLKEIIILCLQLFIFYIIPLFAGPTDVMGVVIISFICTFILSMFLGGMSKEKIKYLYPIIIAILFIPAVFIFYNNTALIYIVYYIIFSYFGLLLGVGISKIKINNKYKLFIYILLSIAVFIGLVQSFKVKDEKIKIDESVYKVTTDLQFRTMQNDGGSHTNEYYLIDTKQNIVEKFQDRYIGFKGYEYKDKLLFKNNISEEKINKFNMLIKDIIAKKDPLKDKLKYDYYIVEYNGETIETDNEEFIDLIKSFDKKM